MKGCFCHFNGYEVKDAKAREDISYLKNYATPQMYGAKGDGVNDDTNAIQTAINENLVVFFPEGNYRITARLTMKKNRHLIGASKDITKIVSNDEEYCFIIPMDADHSTVEHIGFTSGVQIGRTGTASVQDMNTRFSNVLISGGYGLHVGHRGGVYDTVSITNSKYGVVVESTDNTFTNCVVAMVKSHGFCSKNANNSFNNCKAFCCGLEEWGCGFMIAGAFNRVNCCEAQQNFFENFYLKNALSLNLTACLSDGAFYTKTGETYENAEFGEVPTSGVFLHNVKNSIIEIAHVNGSMFGSSHAVTKYAVVSKYPATVLNNILKVTKLDRNNYASNLTNCDVYLLSAGNSVNFNGIDYKHTATAFSNTNIEINHTDTASEKSVNDGVILNNNIKKLYGSIETIEGKDNLKTCSLDVMCVLKSNEGTTLYKNTSSVNVANIFSFNIEEFLANIDYQSIESISLRILTVNKAGVEPFTFKLNNVCLLEL